MRLGPGPAAPEGRPFEVQASGDSRQLGIVSLDQSFKFAAGRGVGVWSTTLACRGGPWIRLV